MPDKIKVSWDDLKSQQVEEKLKRQESLAETRKHYESAPPPETLHRSKRSKILYNSLFYVTAFGILGGLLGWAVGELVHRPNQLAEAQKALAERASILDPQYRKSFSKDEIQTLLDSNEAANDNNPYFEAEIDPTLTPDQRQAKIDDQISRDKTRDFIADILFYGASGLMISLALAVAEPVVDRNFAAAVVNGSVGAIVGLFGGIIVSALVVGIERRFTVDVTNSRAYLHDLGVYATSWGILGIFLTMAPGLVLRNLRRMLVGMLGGLIGGAVGGALYFVVLKQLQSDSIARLIGIVSIGLCAGLGAGLLENVAKAGWLRVTAGLIAGKQFVLYRNPTYLGSSPHCQIYLFKDAQIGKRHAAVHLVSGGFEIENLPLGGPTLVNNAPVTRIRLRNGDQIQIGATQFVFQEKTKTSP